MNVGKLNYIESREQIINREEINNNTN